MDKDITRTGRFLSLILRHDPARIGLTLDSAGWANVDELLKKMNIDSGVLNTIVETNNKKRYSFNENKTKIRANQGHSIKVDLELESVQPPNILYHGTATRFLHLIYKDGIQKMKRHHVHLSDNRDTAIDVGKRHGKVIVLEVDAELMYKDGIEFYKSENGVWLTNEVAPKYLSIINIEGVENETTG